MTEVDDILPFPTITAHPPSPIPQHSSDEDDEGFPFEFAINTKSQHKHTPVMTATTTGPTIATPAATTHANCEKNGLYFVSSSSSLSSLRLQYEMHPTKDTEAGNRPEDYYKTVLPAWRYRLRNIFIPIVRWETPRLARMQKSVRHTGLDIYFVLSACVGTHTFYVTMIPVIWWLGMESTGTSYLFVLAFGVVSTNFVKDLLCLPRPLSPPLHRLTMSGSAALEYGFPSTHTANAVSVALVLACGIINLGLSTKMAILLHCLNGLFVFSIAAGRLYCGMHGFLDVTVGALFGAVLWLIRFLLGDAMDALTHSGSPWTLMIIPVALLLIRTHPEPADNCPCFDDSVAFLGVVVGQWLSYWVMACISGPSVFPLFTYDFEKFGCKVIILRFLIGTVLIAGWRHFAKKFLLKVLPPVFRAVERVGLSMPRKYFIPASQYSDVPSSISSSDNVFLDTQKLGSIFSHPRRSDSVGPQSTADVHESLAYQQYLRDRGDLNFRGKHEHALKEEDDSDESHSATGHDDMMSKVEVPRPKYDVEVITRLIVYAGVAMVVLIPCRYLFIALGV